LAFIERRNHMRWLIVLIATAALAEAQGTECSRGTATVEVDQNTVTIENNFKFVDYTEREVLHITARFQGTCNVVFSGLALRQPQPFTPAKGKVGGSLKVIDDQTPGAVTFDMAFSPLKAAGPKSFATAHLNLALGVDSDCDPSTGDESGIDEPVTVGVQVSVSTASHP